MKIKIIVNGANGKMGHTVVETIANEPDLQLVAATTRHDNLLNAIQTHCANVVIDFTVPNSVFQNTRTIIEAGAHPVIGTSGLTEEQIKMLATDCEKQKRGAIIAPNFSIGAILMMKYAKEAAKYFPDAEIIESHHPAKLDAPSGTAKKTAELIAQNKMHKNTSTPIDQTLLDPHARGKMHCDIPIHSVRLSHVFAEQRVIFSNIGESFTLQHDALDRKAMMPGVYLSCRKVLELQRLIYGLEDLL